MSPYTMQDAAEERRLEDAAWQDAIDAELCIDANHFMDSLPENILSPELQKKMDPIFCKNPKALDALLNGLREAFIISLKARSN